jgi:hypothetical protein
MHAPRPRECPVSRFPSACPVSRRAVRSFATRPRGVHGAGRLRPPAYGCSASAEGADCSGSSVAISIASSGRPELACLATILPNSVSMYPGPPRGVLPATLTAAIVRMYAMTTSQTTSYKSQTPTCSKWWTRGRTCPTPSRPGFWLWWRHGPRDSTQGLQRCL